MDDWFIVDLEKKSLGRAASLIAKLLNIRAYNTYGKRGYIYKLLLVNVNKLITSKRLLKKCYWRHTGYPGGLKCKTARQFNVRDLFMKVLTKMLPNTRIRRVLINNVRLISDSNVNTLSKRATYLES
ncbi:50S ribosomal protein L13 [Candidatus Hodgkinia cicadicola]|nr:50S ribosomal protein L13 [Candidatus Hodgkinia cicadicola]